MLDGGPGTVGDFADEHQLLMRPLAGPLVLNPENGRHPAGPGEGSAGERADLMGSIGRGLASRARVALHVVDRHDLTGLQLGGEVLPEIFRLRDEPRVNGRSVNGLMVIRSSLSLISPYPAPGASRV